MSTKAATTRERNRARSIAALQGMIANTATAPAMRRAAVLRLGRLQAVTRPAPDMESLIRGKMLARDTFFVLNAQRRALLRKERRTPADNIILHTLVASMPATIPDGNAHNSEWCDFVGAVSSTLRAIKDLPSRKPTNRKTND